MDIFKFPGLKFLIPIDIDSISIDIRHINKFLLDSLFLRMLEVLRPKFFENCCPIGKLGNIPAR